MFNVYSTNCPYRINMYYLNYSSSVNSPSLESMPSPAICQPKPTGFFPLPPPPVFLSRRGNGVREKPMSFTITMIRVSTHRQHDRYQCVKIFIVYKMMLIVFHIIYYTNFDRLFEILI